MSVVVKYSKVPLSGLKYNMIIIKASIKKVLKILIIFLIILFASFITLAYLMVPDINLLEDYEEAVSIYNIETILPEEYTLTDMPVSIKDFEHVITYMSLSNIMEYNIVYKGAFSMKYFSDTLAKNAFDAFQHIGNLYIENFSHIRAINVLYKVDSIESTLTISFETEYIDEYKTKPSKLPWVWCHYNKKCSVPGLYSLV